MSDGKIIITGTGRCGTTFLMLIYSYLKEDTGYKRDPERHLYKNCNSGLEKGIRESYRIIKSPFLLTQLREEMEKEEIKIKHILIPIREFQQCAKSRERHKKYAGGLIGECQNAEQQLRYDYRAFSEFMYYCTLKEIPFTLINFIKMVESPYYLYEKIKQTFSKEITLQEFEQAFDKATEQQKKT